MCVCPEFRSVLIWRVCEGGLAVLRCPTEMPVLRQTKQYRSVSADQTGENVTKIESNTKAYCICWRHMCTWVLCNDNNDWTSTASMLLELLWNSNIWNQIILHKLKSSNNYMDMFQKGRCTYSCMVGHLGYKEELHS